MKKQEKCFANLKISITFAPVKRNTNAKAAQLVEHNLAEENKVSNLGKEMQNLRANWNYAEIAQLVEHNLAKVGVASSSLVFRSLWNFEY